MMKLRPAMAETAVMKYAAYIAVFTVMAALSAFNANGQNTTKTDAALVIKLWPANRLVIDTVQNKWVEHNSSKPSDDVIRITGISDPTIQIFTPAHANGTAVIVCPGGGYSILAMDKEGVEICNWFNSFGVTAVLLKYRVPAPVGMLNYQLPLQDAQRALGLVRYNAAKWGIKPGHIGIMGFSAGGHLSAALSNNFDKRAYPAVDAADSISCRPDFAIIVYPGYLTGKAGVGTLAPELQVTDKTPPTFLMQTEDDPVNVENALYYYLALRNAKVPAEMHLYPTGGHGYGMRSKTGGTAVYPELIKKWLADNAF